MTQRELSNKDCSLQTCYETCVLTPWPNDSRYRRIGIFGGWDGIQGQGMGRFTGTHPVYTSQPWLGNAAAPVVASTGTWHFFDRSGWRNARESLVYEAYISIPDECISSADEIRFLSIGEQFAQIRMSGAGGDLNTTTTVGTVSYLWPPNTRQIGNIMPVAQNEVYGILGYSLDRQNNADIRIQYRSNAGAWVNMPINWMYPNLVDAEAAISKDKWVSCDGENATSWQSGEQKTVQDLIDNFGAVEVPCYGWDDTFMSITNIDLQPTANDNEFTVVIEWLDNEWIAQTTTDATPITVTWPDTFGTVLENQTGFTFTTTNGADVDPWEDFIQMPDWTTWATEKCPEEMTRAQLIALRNAGNLSKDCHYVITNPDANGTLLLEKVLIHAVDENTLSGCYLKTAHDNIAWQGFYDIDSNDVLEVTDNLENHVKENASIISFPFGIAAVNDNNVDGGTLIYTAGTVTNCTIKSGGRINMTAWNVINCEISQLSTLNMIDGILRETTIEWDSDVTLRGGDNYENYFGNSHAYNQVGIWYARYSRFTGNTTSTVWDANIANSHFNFTTLNTTWSVWSITLSSFDYSQLTINNIPDLFIQATTLDSFSQVTWSNAARLRLYRSNWGAYCRYLIGADSTLLAQYCNVQWQSYIQSANGGTLTANYCSVSNTSYIRNFNANSNIASQCNVSANSNIRFDGNSANSRVYYSTASGWSNIYHTGNSDNCYIYNNSSQDASTIYTNNSVWARMYYNRADSRGIIYSQWNTVWHRIYQSKASSRGQIQLLNNTAWVWMYSIDCGSQWITRLQNSTAAWRLYYSRFDSYYYALITFTSTWVRSGFWGQWRRSQTITNPVKVNPTLNANYLANI